MKLIKFLVISGMILFFCFFPSVNFLGWILLFIVGNWLINDIRNDWKKEKEPEIQFENKENRKEMTRIYSNSRKKHHEINVNDVLDFGILKACILGNIHLFANHSRDELHKGFPYIKADTFYEYLEDLIEKGLLKEI